MGKDLTMRIWADHNGRPVPESITNDIIIEPWNYWNANKDAIDGHINNYSGKGKPPWIAAAGVSGGHHRGVYGATRYRAKQASQSPNIDGMNITFWCWNNIDEKLLSLFAGAYYLWNPDSRASFADEEDQEAFERIVYPIMYNWQAMFDDADPDNIRSDRGPVVTMGLYHFGGRHGKPTPGLTPDCLKKSDVTHDYLNEHKV